MNDEVTQASPTPSDTPAAPEPTPAPEANDPVPEPIRAIVALFEGSLSSVEFPGISATLLQEKADAIRERSQEIEEMAKKVEAAREQLEQDHVTLIQHAKRALSYIQVYAQDDEALLSEVSGIKLDGAGAKKKKRAKRVSKKAAKKAATASESTTVSDSDDSADPGAPLKQGKGRGPKNGKGKKNK